MKKIVIIALHLNFGGVENFISTLANMLSNYYEVQIISTYKLSNSPAFYINDNVNIDYLMTQIKPNKQELKEAINSKNIFKIFKQIMISIKVLFLRKYLLIKKLKKLDCDIIITTRHFHNKLVGKYANKKIIKIATEHNHHNNNNKYIKKVLNSLKNFNYLLPVSKELTSFYNKALKKIKTKVIYIPHALDIYPNKVSELNNKCIISVGRLSKEKGFKDLIYVFKRIYEKDNSCRLKIVGNGEEMSSLKELINKEDLTNSIELCGFKTKAELEELYLNSSLYLMTSFTESFGLVLLEAESYGLPLIAFDSAQGATEIIENNKNGFLIKNRNIEDMAKKSYKILTDSNLRKQIGNYARNHSQVYTQENISKKWKDFIDNIIRSDLN